jgi:glycosyltransferase involved in cell wall biosynthesis
MRPFKGLEVLASAISTALSQCPEAQFVINLVMKDDQQVPDALQDLADRSQIVLFTNRLKQDSMSLVELLEGADFFLFTSTPDEAFCLTVLQASAKHTPVIGFPNGVLSEFPASSTHGLICEWSPDEQKSAEALSGAIQAACDLWHRRDELTWIVRLYRQFASRYLLTLVKRQWSFALDVNN